MRPQKYKIYVNSKPVFLITPGFAPEIGFNADKTHFFSHYAGKKNLITQYFDMLDKSKAVEAVVLMAADVESLWQDFQSFFKTIEAAGGFVQNKEEKLLVFFRRGSWDMPKGKIDAGETPEIAAIREVREETGLQKIELGKFVMHTWHVYEHKGKKILKKTWWYKMTTSDTKVRPQTEEDIEEIRWVNPQEWLLTEKEIYGSIKDVIEASLK